MTKIIIIIILILPLGIIAQTHQCEFHTNSINTNPFGSLALHGGQLLIGKSTDINGASFKVSNNSGNYIPDSLNGDSYYCSTNSSLRIDMQSIVLGGYWSAQNIFWPSGYQWRFRVKSVNFTSGKITYYDMPLNSIQPSNICTQWPVAGQTLPVAQSVYIRTNIGDKLYFIVEIPTSLGIGTSVSCPPFPIWTVEFKLNETQIDIWKN